VSSFLVSVILVMSLESIGATTRGKSANSDRARGNKLVHALLDEIVAQKFEDDVSPVMGPETGEVTGNRTLFDDVDDYNRWYSTPPKKRDGTALTEFDGWATYVGVYYGKPDNLARLTFRPTEVKKVFVWVAHNGIWLYWGETVVSKGWVRE